MGERFRRFLQRIRAAGERFLRCTDRLVFLPTLDTSQVTLSAANGHASCATVSRSPSGSEGCCFGVSKR